ncbi:MAG: UDP-N-acetylmuramoyl-L-alanyl-D-glutamate--2,6-diaminopimelate ligase [Dehalococcoidia bacterium]|nr:UDP-N-acetylmuramoyl-L-alanyl-D-glutamate--2,6-diaminopimelate ligase [Dehalococcoidia bacterium]
MRLSELIDGLGEVRPLDDDPQIAGIAYDSRRVAPGDLFVAVPGFHTDGRRFIADALARGAVAVVVEDSAGTSPAERCPVITVPSARAALSRLAAAFYGRPALKMRVVGVTGTDGKTTTSHLISAVLERAGYRTGITGTVYLKIGDRLIPNPYHQTTPESLEIQKSLAEMVEARVDYAIIETTSHGLALNRVEECHYDAAVFTNLTSDHMDFHADRDEYLSYKGKLFTSLGVAADKGVPKAAIFNADDPASAYLARVTPVAPITYGIDAEADVRASGLSTAGWGTAFTMATPQERAVVNLPLIGRFNVYNALAAAALGLSQGMGLEMIKDALETFQGVPGRMERVDAGQDFKVVVDFAHTAGALGVALEALRPYCAGKLTVVFGCPGERDRTKRSVMGQVAARLADFVILTSDEPRSEDPLTIVKEIEAGVKLAGRTEGRDYVTLPDRREALAEALGRARSGDVVLLAGKGHEDCIIYGDRRVPWSDRLVALDLLKDRRSI